MALIEFNAQNARRVQPNKRPRLNIGKTGYFNFGKLFTHAVGLKAGDTIAFVWDDERPHDWYIKRSDKGFTLRADDTTIGFGASKVARQIKKLLGVSETTSLNIPLPTEWQVIDGQKMIPLITKGFKIHEVKRTQLTNQPCLN